MVHDAVAQFNQPGQEAADRRRILIVEVESKPLKLLLLRLEGQGFEPILAGSGREALVQARTRKPHLILLDPHLSVLEGFSANGRFSDDPGLDGIPVIIVSGMVRPDIVRCSPESGCRYYVRKPYDPNALLVLIEQAIGECLGG